MQHEDHAARRRIGARIRRTLARVAVTATVLASAVALTPAMPAGAVTDPDAAGPAAPAAGGVCACGAIGDFVEPDDGVLARVVFTSPREGTSPGGRYDIVAGDQSASIYRGADRTTALLTLPTVGSTPRWGFSPDQDRFAVWWIDSNRLFGYALYDLSAPGGAKQIAGESSLTRISSANLAFSRSGSRFIVGYLGDATAMTLKTFDARTGEQQFGEDITVEFPPSDPGGGGDPGASSPAENFDVTVVKGQPLFDVTWDPPHYTGDGAVSDYELTSDPEPPAGYDLTEVGERHLRLSGFTPGIKYTFSLKLINPVGKSAAAESSKVMIPLPKPPKATFADTAPDTAPDAAGLDALASVSSAAWGFSPDDDDRYLMMSTVENGFTRVRIIDLENGVVTLEERVTAATATWGFSPCGEAFGFILSPPTGAKDVKVLSTSTGEQIGATKKATGQSVRLGVYGDGDGGVLSYLLIVDNKGTVIARVPGDDCGEPDPGEEPPSTPEAVTALAGFGRATLTWTYPATGTPVDSFEVQPIVDGKKGESMIVAGSRRAAMFGSGGSPIAPGDYSFVVTAHRGEVAGEPAAATSVVEVGGPSACGLITWSAGPLSGSAKGTATAGGVTASFEYSIAGTAVTVRDTSSRSGSGGARPASSLDGGAPTAAYEHEANSTDSREHVLYYPGWNDYLVTVEARDADGGVSLASAVVHVAPSRAPANDAFARATELTGTQGDLAGDSTWTTCESSEPGTEDDTIYTQWFEITPDAESRIVIEGYSPTINIYSGDDLASLTAIGQELGRWPKLRQSASLDAGETYHVQIAAEQAVPEFTSPWRLYPAPPNDDRENATLIDPSSEKEYTVDINGAGIEPGEPDACSECSTPTVASVWFTWTATTHEWVTLESDGPVSDQDFFVADPQAPLGVTLLDQTRKPKHPHRSGIEQEVGVTYFARISNDSAAHLYNGPENPYPVSFHAAPANDYIVDAVPLDGESGAVPGSNLWSYLEWFEGTDAAVRSGAVWYRWTAEKSGPISFLVDSDEIVRPEVYVLTDEPADPELIAPSRVQLAENDAQPRTTFDAVAGESYLLLVTGRWTSAYTGITEGPYTLRWDAASVPSAPHDIVAQQLPGTDRLSVTWKDGDDGNADILSHRVTVTPELPTGGTIVVDQVRRTAVVRGTESGETYTVQVAVRNVVGLGPVASSEPVTTDSGPRIETDRVAASEDEPFEQALTVVGGTAPFAFAMDGGPEWLRLDATTGTLSGTPDAPGTFAVDVRVTDADDRSATRTVSIVVTSTGPVDPLTIGFATSDVTVDAGTPLRVVPVASGGVVPYLFQLGLDAPAWAGIEGATGAVVGTPAEGDARIRVVVTDAAGTRAEASLVVHAVAPNGDPDPGALPASTIAGDPVPGGTLTATLVGFAAGSTVELWLHSTPIPLGTVVADASGAARVTFVVPQDFRGEHRVEGIGIAPDGTPRVTSVSFVIAGEDGPAVLGATGVAGILSWVAVGLLLLGGGLVAVLILRRRQRV